MPRRNLQILMLAIVVCAVCYARGTRHRYAPTIADAIGIVTNYYIEPVDRRQLYENAMTGMLNNLDEYSSFIPPASYSQLQEDLDQEFAGVGIEVGIDPDSECLLVLSPIFNSPAYHQGIRAGDLIVQVEGQQTAGMKLDQAVELIRGQPGTSISLSIQPYGTDERASLTVERASVQKSSVLGDSRNRDGTWNYVFDDQPDIAYLRIVSFGEATSFEVAQALKPLANKTIGAVIDLRANPGGLLNAAVELCDLFLPEGPVVSVRRRSGFSRRGREATARDAVIASAYESTDEIAIPQDYPIAVVIDRYSASASEIVAACLQDHKRAVIVGQRSFGKGTVQNVFDLEGGLSGMKLTTATYWRPSGTNIHRFSTDSDEDTWGVQPDEGYQVVYNQEQMFRRYRERRLRDFIPEVRNSRFKIESLPESDEDAETVGDENQHESDRDVNLPDENQHEPEDDDTDTSAETDASPSEAEPFADTQLQRAIEYLRSSRDASREAA